ncbi:MAG: hypothetical protein KJ057_15745 [Phycisphaerae bacterium]|nr:MAG: hypothetical protein EDS66_10525 [Planctomycetota bacterium]KAB2948689.1 MAG: hypothetical protein F9K17_05640 [Phycisphaerae bacterium]MBE7455564.1 hypothetical protein [Planctomycetia bacterium]MCK6466172.1 hypothetical protein [Phycisphaerae bacterium]MCL4719923.1 hypothetical protein [Phycisphaerae bacterium]
MMRVEIDPVLIEKAVFFACREDASAECELHNAVDPLYPVGDDPRREEAFRAVFMHWFHRLGLHGQIADFLAERPELEGRVTRCLVREAPAERDESVEVLAPRSDAGNAARTLVIQITPQRLASGRLSCDALRRELLHAADIVNPRFAFRRDDLLGGSPRENLVRDRYHVLWRACVEGRLLRERRLEQPVLDAILRAASRAFGSARTPEKIIEQGVAEFLRRDDVTHPDLLAAARDPALLCIPVAAASRTEAGTSNEPDDLFSHDALPLPVV